MRRVIFLILLASLFVMPAAAQGRVAVPDVIRYAEYAPDGAVGFAVIRTDTGFREQTTALLDRLDPIIGSTPLNDFMDDIANSPEMGAFLGDGIGIIILSAQADFSDLMGDASPVAIILGIKDPTAVTDLITETNDLVLEERNGWKDYRMDSEVRALLRGDVMIVTPNFAYADQVVSGDYGKLTNNANFTAAVSRLPEDRYDFLLYGDLSAIVGAQGGGTRRSGIESVDALVDMLGTGAIGGVNIGGRDLLLDVSWLYGDLAGIGAYGFTPEMFTGPAVDLTLARRLAPDTQFYAQTVNFGGMLTQFLGLLNVMGGLLGNDEAVEFFGLGGAVNENLGDTAKAGATLALAAATGLSFETDVLNVLDGDFALHLSLYPTESPHPVRPSLGIVLEDSGQGANYTRALVNTLDRAGMPISRVPLRGGGEALDLSAFTDPLWMSLGGADAANDPNFDTWFGTNGEYMALGTAPSVQFALQPGDETLESTPAYQHAVQSAFLEGSQAIAFINVGALVGFPEVPAEMTDRVESLSASSVADDAGVMLRLAVSLK